MIVLPVLVRPRYPGNVGAAVRVAANFGVGRLALVAPEADLGDPDFVRMAMGAEKIVTIETFDDAGAALAGADLVVGTTSARDRDPRGLASAREVAVRAGDAATRRMAVVFGPERGGLRHDELARCHLLLSVPTAPAFPVLNLAQAVGIVLFALADEPAPDRSVAEDLDLPAGNAELQAALAHLEAALATTGFLDPVNPARVMDQLRRLLGRAIPTGREVAIVRGIASHLEYLRRRAGKPVAGA